MNPETRDSKLILFACLLLCAGVFCLTSIPLHAEGLAEIQSRCIQREITSLPENNRLTVEWQKNPHHRVAFSGTTNSMEPAIAWWDTVFLREVTPDERLCIGAVYVYDDATWTSAIQATIPENLTLMGIMHQLVRVSGDNCLFRGLNNARYDPWAKRSAVKWVVCRVLGVKHAPYAVRVNP